jgi:hypothetical protein
MANKFLVPFTRTTPATTAPVVTDATHFWLERQAPPRTAAATPPPKPVRITVGIDATGSREESCAIFRDLTDTALALMPGQIELRLAVHGGGKLHTLSPYTTDADRIRATAAAIKCRPGRTAMLEMLQRCIGHDRPEVVIYIGDVFEEDEQFAMKVASRLAAQQTRIVVLHDLHYEHSEISTPIFNSMARLTEGAVIPFDHYAIEPLREIIEGVTMLAVGGTEMVAAQAPQNRGAQLLLQHLTVNISIK